MEKIDKNRLKYYNFLNSLPKKLNKLYFSKLKGKFKLDNKSKKKRGFDPVTNIDKAFEFFLRKEIIKKFPNDGIIGEEFKTKKSKSGYTWVIDPIDGTRSFIIGSPTWSNLISVNYKNEPTFGLANFPIIRKYYITGPNNFSYLVENNKFKLSNLPAGLYKLWGFEVLNTQNPDVYFSGLWTPYHRAARFATYSDTIDVRARWDVEDINIYFK